MIEFGALAMYHRAMAGTRWARGSTRDWRERVRPAVFARDEGRCKLAFEGEWTTRDGVTRRCLGRATEVHHTQAREVVGDDIEFLVAACRPCNRKAGDPTSGDPTHRTMTAW